MEILFAYAFEGGYIFETKNTTLPSSAPIHEIFQWYLRLNENITTLEFSSCSDSTRSFKNGLYLDMSTLTMTWKGSTYHLSDVKNNVSYYQLMA